jgi:hypothetical protein
MEKATEFGCPDHPFRMTKVPCGGGSFVRGLISPVFAIVEEGFQ